MGVSTDYQDNISVDQAGHTAVHRYHGSFDWYDCPDGITWADLSFRDGASGPPGGSDIGFQRVFGCSGTITDKTSNVTLAADTDWGFRARMSLQPAFDTPPPPSPFVVNGTWIFFRSYAVTATASAPAASNITQTTADLTCNFVPNTNVSVVTARLQYRIAGSGSGWTEVTTGGYSTSGYGSTTASGSVSGLTCGTTYEIRLVVDRTTSNATQLISASSTFSTTSCAPSVTTGSASSIGSSSATLNGTYDLNSISSRVRFGWGTSDAGTGTWANYTAYQNVGPSDGDTAFSDGISGLSPSTGYFFRAFVEHPSPGFGNLVQGATSSFTTPANPLAVAAQEDHLLTFEYEAVYGVARSFVFCGASPAATSSDKLLSAAVPWANTECIIVKYNSKANPVSAGAWALSTLVNADGRSTNAPTRIGSTAFYQISLVAGELDANEVWIWLSDAGNAVRDVLIRIRMVFELGQFKTDITQLGGNNPGFTVTGVGTSPGLATAGGSTSRADISGAVDGHIIRRGTATAGGASTIDLDASASATNDFYNGCIITLISGTGPNQSRVILDYDGSNKRCTVDSPWLAANPASGTVFVITPGDRPWFLSPSSGDANFDADGLTAAPSTLANFGQKLQAVFQRFYFKRTQTASVHTLFDASGNTLATASVSDDTVTQQIGKLS